MERKNSVILDEWLTWLLRVFVLNRLVVLRVLSYFGCVVGSCKIVYHFTTVFHWLAIKWSSKVQVWLDTDLVRRDGRWALVSSHYRLVSFFILSLFQVGAHLHLLLEIDFGQRIVLLPVLNFLVPLVN